MRILIVDDSAEKLEEFDCYVRAVSANSSPVHVRTLADAVRITTEIPFDLVILDLMIPYMQGGPANSDAGYELMRQMRRSGVNRHTKVVAISAFPAEVQSYRARFDQMSVLITNYEEPAVWQGALSVAISDVASGRRSIDPVEFLIVCALDIEREGFSVTHLTSISDASVGGLNIQYVRLGAHIGGVLRCSQMGLVTATYEVSRALDLLKPRAMLMSGICAGVRGQTELGQIVAASLAWEYQAGKWATDGFEIAPLQVPMPAATRAIIDHLFDKAGYSAALDIVAAADTPRPPSLHKPKIGPMASGSAVIADESRLEHIRLQHRKLVALDMESFGVFYAAHETNGRLEHFGSIKTVVDLADNKKGDLLHKYGSRTAALVCVDILERILE